MLEIARNDQNPILQLFYNTSQNKLTSWSHFSVTNMCVREGKGVLATLRKICVWMASWVTDCQGLHITIFQSCVRNIKYGKESFRSCRHIQDLIKKQILKRLKKAFSKFQGSQIIYYCQSVSRRDLCPFAHEVFKGRPICACIYIVYVCVHEYISVNVRLYVRVYGCVYLRMRTPPVYSASNVRVRSCPKIHKACPEHFFVLWLLLPCTSTWKWWRSCPGSGRMPAFVFAVVCTVLRSVAVCCYLHLEYLLKRLHCQLEILYIISGVQCVELQCAAVCCSVL